MLLFATSFWGTTFLLMKALGQCQQQLVPGASTWFLSALSLLFRFVVGALVLLCINPKVLGNVTRLEFLQGAGLGLFGGIGLIFQMDGVQHTPASTSAFLTQCYCIIIPVLVALRQRRWPHFGLSASSIMVLGGVIVLAGVKWSDLRLGRGEMETILASILFTGQILWVERPVFAANKTGAVTIIMFAVVSAVVLPVVLVTAAQPGDIIKAFSTVPALAIGIYLTLACTVLAFTVMNRWQCHISSTHASLIYSSEPVFTSVFALFLPAVLSPVLGINYANESLTWRLLLGGGLITLANVVVFWHASRVAAQSAEQKKKALQRKTASAVAPKSAAIAL